MNESCPAVPAAQGPASRARRRRAPGRYTDSPRSAPQSRVAGIAICRSRRSSSAPPLAQVTILGARRRMQPGGDVDRGSSSSAPLAIRSARLVGRASRRGDHYAVRSWPSLRGRSVAHGSHLGSPSRALENGACRGQQQRFGAQRTSSCRQLRTMSALGRERPVSTKLRCRADTPVSSARSSWLSRRRRRQSRRSGPTPGVAAAVAMAATLAVPTARGTYLAGNRRAHLALGPRQP